MVTSTGSIYQEVTLKGPRGQVVAYGRLRGGINQVYGAQDFGMNCLRSIVVSPYFAVTPTAPGTTPATRAVVVAHGSIGSLDTDSNYVRVRAMRYIKLSGGAYAYPGTPYLGTLAGSITLNYTAIGR